MKVVFVGPSLWGEQVQSDGLIFRGPASAGDIAAAVREGATTVGLVDGFFGWVASTWHKELLYALSEGVAVFGAASMGALRAAELHEFGMIPIGGIAADYISGSLDDDAAVSLTSGPEDLNYMPFTEPLVDAVATIAQMRRVGAITDAEEWQLDRSARSLFFQRRTVEEIVRGAVIDSTRCQEIAAAYDRHRVHRKRDDALALVRAIQHSDEQPPRRPFPRSAFWHLVANR